MNQASPHPTVSYKSNRDNNKAIVLGDWISAPSVVKVLDACIRIAEFPCSPNACLPS